MDGSLSVIPRGSVVSHKVMGKESLAVLLLATLEALCSHFWRLELSLVLRGACYFSPLKPIGKTFLLGDLQSL
jgi:hypothetical protein